MLTETQHKRRSGSSRFSLLALLGALLMMISLIGLYPGPDVLQYAFLPEVVSNETSVPAPESSSDVESAMEDEDSFPESRSNQPSESVSPPENTSAAWKALGQYDEMVDSSVWAGEDVRMTIHGQKSDVSVSRPSGGAAGDVRLILAGPRYMEIFPREIMEGTAFSSAEVSGHALSAILDSRLSFALFRDVSPIGKTVQISGKEYTVVGVARHNRSLGASNELTAWVTLGGDGSLIPDLLVVSALHAQAGDGFTTLWRSQAESVFGDGTFLSFPREKARASLLPRLLCFFFGVFLIRKWFHLLHDWGRRFLADAHRRLAGQYVFSLTGYFTLRILAALILTAASLAAMYALAVFITRPLLIFPEWVPEKPVAMSSILSRFWSLIGENASPVTLVTEQAATLRFWHFLIRLGTFLFLLGLLRFRNARPEESVK